MLKGTNKSKEKNMPTVMLIFALNFCLYLCTNTPTLTAAEKKAPLLPTALGKHPQPVPTVLQNHPPVLASSQDIFETPFAGSYHLNQELKKDYVQFKHDIHQASQDIGSVIGAVISPTIGEYIKGTPKAIERNSYKDTVANVTIGNDLCPGEKQFLRQRLPIVKAALEKLLNLQLTDNHVPNIAIACSGGGYRSMLYTAGFLSAAEQSGILETTTYLTGLSGSTWAIAPWISTQKSLEEFKNYIKECAARTFTEPTDHEQLLIFDAIEVKNHYNQEKTWLDLYGHLLGNVLLEYFKNDRYMVYASEQAEIIKTGKLPYPIYTAIDANEHLINNQNWYEFTPHQIGNPIDATYIPTWSYGRNFKEGTSRKGKHQHFPPEQSLAHQLGTFGSAFGADIHTIEQEIAKKMGHIALLEALVKPIEGKRPIHCYDTVPNWEYKLDVAHERAKNKHKTFVDAGTDFNLPIPPISGLNPERKADVIIICEASAGTIGHQLEKVAAYMKKHTLPFPKITMENIDKKTISIFKEEDPNVPVVIYLPRISDQNAWEQYKNYPEYAHYNLSKFDLDYETESGFAQTSHFHYSSKNEYDHAEKVMNQAAFNFLINQTNIIEAIKYAVERKGNKKEK
jgi:hypothetical protein